MQTLPAANEKRLIGKIMATLNTTPLSIDEYLWIRGHHWENYGILILLFEGKKLKLICDIQTMAFLFKLATIPKLQTDGWFPYLIIRKHFNDSQTWTPRNQTSNYWIHLSISFCDMLKLVRKLTFSLVNLNISRHFKILFLFFPWK